MFGEVHTVKYNRGLEQPNKYVQQDQSRLPSEYSIMPPGLAGKQQAMAPQCLVCIGSPLMSSTEVCDPHVSGESPQQLDHPQHKEHVRGEVLHCHLLHWAVRIKGVNPAAYHTKSRPATEST